jgi:uncharacterized protein (DUF1015 family)
MADVRPFRALRYAPTADPALAIAPPYDVISPADQQALYERSAHNVVRIEYGVQRKTDTESDSRYTRAAADLARWRAEGVLALDDRPAIYGYRQEFAWADERYTRQAWFAALRLEEWEKGVVKPHEHTLANPKADRLSLLRATRAQISPVYSLFRERASSDTQIPDGEPLFDFDTDQQRHVLSAITDGRGVAAFQTMLAASDVYIADGHHRYETALSYRDEVRSPASSWTGEEPDNFVLMALTRHDDPGLLVLPTHRLVHIPLDASEAMTRIHRYFEVESARASDHLSAALRRMHDRGREGETAFAILGADGGRVDVLTLADRTSVEALMPREQSAAWKRLDVNVLQYGVLLNVFGIDDEALKAGGAVSYVQDPMDAQRAVASGAATYAFLLNATPVEQVLAVSDAGGRMPQKSTYFYPKLPTGLVIRALA